MTWPLAIEDVCSCDPMPVMWWWFPEVGWEVVYSLDDTRDAAADRRYYEETGATGWLIACPECHRQYVTGQ